MLPNIETRLPRHVNEVPQVVEMPPVGTERDPASVPYRVRPSRRKPADRTLVLGRSGKPEKRLGSSTQIDPHLRHSRGLICGSQKVSRTTLLFKQINLATGGGGGGIRTRETIHHRLHALQACAFDRSATPPPGGHSNEAGTAAQ